MNKIDEKRYMVSEQDIRTAVNGFYIIGQVVGVVRWMEDRLKNIKDKNVRKELSVSIKKLKQALGI